MCALSRKQQMIERNALQAVETFRLFQLVEAEFSNRNVSDIDFAAYAAESLKNPKINKRHILSARKSLNIPSSKQVNALANMTVIARIEKLEAQVTRLLAQAGKTV